MFFDRDGVINDLIQRSDGSFTSPWSIDEFSFKDYVKESIKIVKNLGYMTFVVTNQPAVHDGLMTKEQLELINKMLMRWLGIDDVLCALDKNSNLYKPENGMIELLIKQYNVDRNSSYMIGDRWKDIVPGRKSKLTTMFVGAFYECPEEYNHIQPDYECIDILEACCTILEIDNAGV